MNMFSVGMSDMTALLLEDVLKYYIGRLGRQNVPDTLNIHVVLLCSSHWNVFHIVGV